MTRQAGSPKIDATRPALTDVSCRAPGLEKEPCDIASVLSDELCSRCSGLLVRSYTAALERTSPAGRSRCGVASTAVTVWTVTFWPTDGKVLSRYFHVQDHGQGLNTPDGRVERRRARRNTCFLVETIRR
jgi:hypothetical protein